jgi:cytochrome bd-type quinol oxidase subunit 1
VTALEIWISLVVFVAIYAVLGVADAYLMIHYGRKELGESSDKEPDSGSPPDRGGDGSERESEPDESQRVPALIY